MRLYECKKCGNRFLSMQTMSRIPCPDCAAEIDYEIGPDETMEDVVDTAVLVEKIEGEEGSGPDGRPLKPGCHRWKF